MLAKGSESHGGQRCGNELERAEISASGTDFDEDSNGHCLRQEYEAKLLSAHHCFQGPPTLEPIGM